MTFTIFKSSISVIITIAILPFILCSCQEEQLLEKPNILFIMSDDHTAQAWGIYGGILKDYIKNDNIKRLAAEGAVLENTFCTNSICVPSRASIMTGQYSHLNGIYTLSEGLNPDTNNVAKLLQSGGYETAIVGKWHLKKEPSGFDHYMVLPGQGRYDDPLLKTKEKWEDANKGGQEYEGYSADVIGDESVKWLTERDSDNPFFLMTQFKATHGPFDYPDRYEEFLKDIDLPEPESLYDFDGVESGRTFKGQQIEELARRMVFGTNNPNTHWGVAPGLPFSIEGLNKIETRKKTYQAFVRHILRGGAAIDDNIGKLLDYLDESGLRENTVVIYTADQGYFLGEHGFFDKRMMYEESLRMPFVIRYPKEIDAGIREDEIILNIDFPSLFLDYAGINQPSSMQGHSFRNILKGQDLENWRTSMYYRYWLHEDIRPGHFGIRNERYKLIFFYGQPLAKPGADEISTSPSWEFYDLDADPKEDRNAYSDQKYQAIITEMKEELLTLKNQMLDTDSDHPVMAQIINDHF